MLLSKNTDLSPDSFESTIKNEWRTIQFDDAKRQKFERAADRLTSEVKDALDIEANAAPTRDSGGASGGHKRVLDNASSDASSKCVKPLSESNASLGPRRVQQLRTRSQRLLCRPSPATLHSTVNLVLKSVVYHGTPKGV